MSETNPEPNLDQLKAEWTAEVRKEVEAEFALKVKKEGLMAEIQKVNPKIKLNADADIPKLEGILEGLKSAPVKGVSPPAAKFEPKPKISTNRFQLNEGL